MTGTVEVLQALDKVSISDLARRCGVSEELITKAARRIAAADSVSIFDDLGVQQAPHSTPSS